jgi:hypothetical protein
MPARIACDLEEADAWQEYLEAARSSRQQSEQRYREIEPWAWARLTVRLRPVKTKRKRKLK